MARQRRLEIAILIAIVALVALWARHSYIPTFHDRHVEVSEQKYNFDVGNPGPWFSAWSLGDGQAYVLIALDPTGGKLDEEIDEAGYRFARASYGWATAAASLGRNTAIPYALAAVGLASLIGLVVVTTRLAERLGRKAWLVVVNPAIYIGFAGDTPEPLAVLLLALSMSGAGLWASAVLGVTRPTYLIALWGQWRRFVVGAAAATLLAVYSALAFGLGAMSPAGGRLGLPLASYIEHSSSWGWLLALVALATLVVGWRRRDWAWVLAAAFVLCFGDDVLRDPVNAWRAAGFLPVLWAFGRGYRVPARNRSDAEASAVG